ncbi:hypothetical protein SK128_028143, partial [Halocaridina rubra]
PTEDVALKTPAQAPTEPAAKKKPRNDTASPPPPEETPVAPPHDNGRIFSDSSVNPDDCLLIPLQEYFQAQFHLLNLWN